MTAKIHSRRYASDMVCRRSRRDTDAPWDVTCKRCLQLELRAAHRDMLRARSSRSLVELLGEEKQQRYYEGCRDRYLLLLGLVEKSA